MDVVNTYYQFATDEQMDVKLNKLNKGSHNFPKIATRETIDAILEHIREGSTKRHAAESCGVSEPLFYTWIHQGRLDLTYEIDTIHAYLVKSLAKIAREEIKHCRSAIKMCPKGHTGAQWTLEHAYWQDFGHSAGLIEIDKKLREIEFQQLEKAKKLELGEHFDLQDVQLPRKQSDSHLQDE